MQGLVDRGTYRSLDRPGAGRRARFQLAPQGYRFPAGHRLKVEVTANDVPYFQQSNVPAVVQVESMSITLPLLEATTAPAAPAAPAAPESVSTPLAATGRHTPWVWIAVALVSLALWRAVRPPAGPAPAARGGRRARR